MKLGKLKISNPGTHIFYWIFVVFVLTLVFGRSWGDKLQAFYFISLLLPVVMATSYFFNYVLVPRFLLKKRYFLFGLYFFYTLVVSLYLELIVLMFSFIYLANFNLGEMGPYAADTLILGIVLYLLVFLGSFILMMQQISINQHEIQNLKNEKEKLADPFLELISNRRTIRIPFNQVIYIESLADYIKVNTTKGEEIISKEKISKLENSLPDLFLRIHRSFIVNTQKISGFNYEEIEIEGINLTIGRSYKKKVLSRLKTN